MERHIFPLPAGARHVNAGSDSDSITLFADIVRPFVFTVLRGQQALNRTTVGVEIGYDDDRYENAEWCFNFQGRRVTCFDRTLRPQQMVSVMFAFTVRADQLVFNKATVDIENGYDYEVYENAGWCHNIQGHSIECSDSDENGTGSGSTLYNHLLKGDYAALHFMHFDNDWNVYPYMLGYDSIYGVRSQWENLPADKVSYRIDHLLGSFRPSGRPTTALEKILHGSGSLRADFAGGDFRLNLDIDDHEGGNFARLSDVQLLLGSGGHHISNFDCLAGRRSAGTSCEGSLRYADDALASIPDMRASLSGEDRLPALYASFYGPNGEELAGGFHHDSAGRIAFNFIGRKNSRPPDPLAPFIALGPHHLNTLFASRYDSASKVSDSGEQFLLYNEVGSALRNGRTYNVIRNSSEADGIPTVEVYHVVPDTISVTLAGLVSFGTRQVNAGSDADSITLFNPSGLSRLLTVAGSPLLAFTVRANQLAFNNVTIAIQPGYDYDVYEDPDFCERGGIDCRVGVMSHYNHFLKGEQAALYLAHDSDSLYYTEHYGVLTKRENLPADNVSYRIDHVLGSYQAFSNSAGRDKILHGSGRLQADFADGEFRLNLDVNDHDGGDFAELDNVRLFLSSGGSQIHNFDCGNGGSRAGACEGSLNYADAALRDITDMRTHDDSMPAINASFYGPNGQEIAGGFHDDFAGAAAVNLGFIGKQDN